MRKLNRDKTYFTFTCGFENPLERLSPYCFISDFPVSERDRYFFKGIHTYENAYLIHKQLKDALVGGKVSEEEILFFQDNIDLNKYFFYVETEFPTVSIESLTTKGKYTLDFINSTLKNQFSEAVQKTLNDIKEKLKELVTKKEELISSELTESSYIDFIKKSFLVFLHDVESSPFIAVQSTFILYSENYDEVKKFIFNSLSLTNENRRNKIVEETEKFESILKINKILPRKRFFQSIVEADIKNYDYGSAIRKLEESGAPREIIAILSYAQQLFENTEQFDWDIRQALIESIELTKNLSNGFVDFNHLEDEKEFMEIKRKLSKAQIFLKKGDYSNFVSLLQKFMEGYLGAIGVIAIKIKDKREKALEQCGQDCNDDLKKSIVHSIAVCFNESPIAEIKSINSEYKPLNHIRNDLQHADIGQTQETFYRRLRYLVEETLGEEENTGHFQKYLHWFRMPETNIFDQINQRVMELLSKPDLIFLTGKEL